MSNRMFVLLTAFLPLLMACQRADLPPDNLGALSEGQLADFSLPSVQTSVGPTEACRFSAQSRQIAGTQKNVVRLAHGGLLVLLPGKLDAELTGRRESALKALEDKQAAPGGFIVCGHWVGTVDESTNPNTSMTSRTYKLYDEHHYLPIALRWPTSDKEAEREGENVVKDLLRTIRIG